MLLNQIPLIPQGTEHQIALCSKRVLIKTAVYCISVVPLGSLLSYCC